MKIRFYVGIDISDETLDVCVLDRTEVVLECQIKNKKKALAGLFKRLQGLEVTKSNTWFCAEHTGLYGLTLRQAIETYGFIYSMVPAIEIIRSSGLTRGKSDKVDAQRIAVYARRFKDKLRPSKLPLKYLGDLKELYTYRKQLVKKNSASKNFIKRLKKVWDSASNRFIIKAVKKELRDREKVIVALERQMTELIESVPKAAINYGLAKSVLGIGSITACYLLICTENFTLFNDVRKFASYSGLAPFEHSSGKSIKGKTRTSKYRNKDIKTLLHNGLNSVISRENEFNRYYKRKLEEGKHKNSVKNAVAFKMVARVFASVKRKTPYVSTYATNFN